MAARPGEVRAGREARARRVPGQGEAHHGGGRRGTAMDGVRGEGRRRRREGLAGAPAQQGRRPVKGRNRPRGGRRSSPHEESSHDSPQATNRGGDGAPGGGNGAPAAQRAREEGEGRLICGPKSSDSHSTFSRLRPFFQGGCPGGEDDGGGRRERGCYAGAAPVTPHARTGMRGQGEGTTTREGPQGHFCPFDRLSFLFLFFCSLF